MGTSRTPEGKHVTRFIVLRKNASDTKFVRSVAVPDYFATKELAQAEVAMKELAALYPNVQYKVRQK